MKYSDEFRVNQTPLTKDQLENRSRLKRSKSSNFVDPHVHITKNETDFCEKELKIVHKLQDDDVVKKLGKDLINQVRNIQQKRQSELTPARDNTTPTASGFRHESFSNSIGAHMVPTQNQNNGMEKYFKMIMDKIETLETN